MSIITCRTRDANGVAAYDYRSLYLTLGWPILPIYEPLRVGPRPVCSCPLGSRCDRVGKHPRSRHGVSDATTNSKTVWDWWWQWPDANVAIATGRRSGLLVLDVDPRNGGDKTMVALAKKLGPLPPMPTVETGDGWQMFFSCPQGADLRTKAGPGVDVLADDRYVIAPLSRHRNGRLYLWVVRPDDCPPPPLPPSWLVEITRPNILQYYRGVDTLTGGSRGAFWSASEESEEVESYVGKVIPSTLPSAHGTRNDCLKRFLIELYRHPELAGKSAESMRPYAEQWHRRARPRIRTKSFATTWREAKAIWSGIDPRKQQVDGLAEVAFQDVPPAFAVERGYGPNLVRLVLLCRALQRAYGEEPFYLATRKAGQLIGVSRATISKYFGRLIGDDVVRLVRRYEPRERKADEWRYLKSLDLTTEGAR